MYSTLLPRNIYTLVEVFSADGVATVKLFRWSCSSAPKKVVRYVRPTYAGLSNRSLVHRSWRSQETQTYMPSALFRYLVARRGDSFVTNIGYIAPPQNKSNFVTGASDSWPREGTRVSASEARTR